jgi:flagellar biosynthesis protein FlhG
VVTAVAGSLDTHYAALGLEPRASREQVEKAYRFSLEMYGDGALATYSLLAADDVRAARSRIASAYEVLSDPARRREYDLSLGLSVPSGLLPFPQTGPLAARTTSQPGPASTSPSSPAPEAPRPPDEPPLPLPAPKVLPDLMTGADLKKVRESCGVSLRAIALVTKIGVRYLEYIEEDRIALLPAPVYLRGFLMEYGRALGLDPRRTADSYMARLPREA